MPDAVLDLATIAELRRTQIDYGNPSFIRQLVGIFQTNAPKRMAQIREAVTARDAHALEHVAHTLKSNCAMLGALKMADYCARFEQWGERAAFHDAEALLSTAEAEFGLVLAALDDVVAAGGDGTQA